MAWTNPSSYSAGNTLTAAGLNTNMVDNLRSLRQMLDKSCKLRLDVGDQTISSGSFTAINWQGADWNVGSMWSSGSNTSRVTPGTIGYYEFGGIVQWQDSSAGTRALYLERNALTRFPLDKRSAIAASGGGNDSPIVSWSFQTYVSATGDYFALQVWHNAAGSLDIRSHTLTGTVLWCRLLGTT